MLPTPDLSHLTYQDYRNVYEPAEDTFLLLDSLEEDQEYIKKLKPKICLEIGSGSGCVITFLGQIVGNNSIYLTTDINPEAAKITQRTGKQNKVKIDAINTDLTNGLLPRLKNSVDIICFNPPYVVTESSDINSSLIAASWAGGVDGREVTDRVLPLIPKLLSPGGSFYLLLIQENKPQEIVDIMETKYNLKYKLIKKRRAGIEQQYVLKFTKQL
ncbi:S-adenosyl-L-methionine-dependent methyltransferase [Neocallimastix lanati (nom. inval.)]|jgi:release factor glutamine methyltransferase|uniref:S-adenosyl-L-methionine-dependent methyltransferase n=1 Tax=Neocallimastix californiae TaxID=1754190 RepID=A0A1Y2EN61_9FUNG|nr:S-adenosyl-L-methionine-dependent methyltransferase [Neocallimastix sp. JGI-2020a]ORY72998.1 S-adenosyl-L-methionine-dependent methyltransferase [Neocallimastix californiae]|eukprot:ORY72998.1 S-adenosyl-L-methionine-dependent methyltransferase [Neocallimastix californiae]